ncbi:hypothetical protein [Leptospira barantonii]|uniref:Secreted protein n=1 Tax=Leptospira barantonii TaxID=2023184 RepID=A0ABX4NNW0_9LEPT|nr:hypothetical protein [Leptospira barantonii]PJZ57312.1 hypothetical protein CH367_11330 [Leptospira barantonii]
MFRENRITTLLLFAGLSASVDCSERTTTNPLAYDNTQRVFYANAHILQIIQSYLNSQVPASGNDSHKQTKNCVFCHSDSVRI